MKTLTFALVALGIAAVMAGCGTAAAGSGSASPRGEIELAIYGNDFSLVRESRPVSLGAGLTRLALRDVSKGIDSGSLSFDLRGGGGAQIVSSAYDMGVSTSDELLDRFLGKRIELVTYGENGREAERMEGILEVAEPGRVVVRAGEKYLINPPGAIVAPAGAGIVAVPQLVANAEASRSTQATLDVAYLTRGMSWSADYVARLTSGDVAEVEVWATVLNQTGVDFPDAKVTLVAGSPNRAVSTLSRRGRSETPVESSSKMPVVEEDRSLAAEAVGELYAYPVRTRTALLQGQINRLKMIESDRVAIKRDYTVRLPELGEYGWYGGGPSRRNAQLAIRFFNLESSGIGSPLPRGVVRVYETDSSGSSKYVGASAIGDTPKDARVDLTLTKVFDVYAEPKMVSSKSLPPHRYRRVVEVELRNEKSSAVTVRVVQPFYGSWKIIAESLKGVKLRSGLNQWSVQLPADSRRVLEFTVETS